MPGEVRRAQVRADVRAAAQLGDADYAWACTITDRSAGSRTPEDWARAVFEHNPALLRAFLLAGWRLGLGLRLGPARSPEHVLGWAIRSSGPERIDLTADSRLMATENVVILDDAGVTWVTFVSYRSGLGRLLWMLAAPLHQALLPRLLVRARRR